MLRNPNDIHIMSWDELFAKYKVSQKDISTYRKLVSEGREDIAVSYFMEDYIYPPIDQYYKYTNEYLIEAEKGELKKDSGNNLIKMVPIATFGLLLLLNENFRTFVSDVIGDFVFEVRKITSKKVRDAILSDTIGQFETLTTEALTNTQSRILKNIRRMQREMIAFNQSLVGSSAKRIDSKTEEFLKKIPKLLPEYSKLKEGKFISSRAFGKDDRVRFYSLKDYLDMSTNTTILNIDRIATQIYVYNREREIGNKKGRYAVNVVEYVKISNRRLKTGKEREICKSILSEKIYGKSLLALDDQTAKIFGIKTVDEVRGTPDYAMGVWCRHGIRPVSVRVRKELEHDLKTYYEG